MHLIIYIHKKYRIDFFTKMLKNNLFPIAAFLHVHLEVGGKSNNEIWREFSFLFHLF